jgi:N-acylneuraminate cytidylyltransferase
VLSGFYYGMFNPWWAHFQNDEGHFVRLLKEAQVNTRSQDLPELLCPSGATWISNINSLMSYGSFYSPEYKFYTINWKDAVDIDDADDLDLAKAVYLLKDIER